MRDSLTITSDGPLIVSTDYWDGRLNRDGLYYLSVRGDVMRLLVPCSAEAHIHEMETAAQVILSRPRNPGRFAAELLFDDRTDLPFVLHLDPLQVDPFPLPDAERRTNLECTVWTRSATGTPEQVMSKPAAYRVVPRVPWLKFWENG